MHRKQRWWPALIGYYVRTMGLGISNCAVFLFVSYFDASYECVVELPA